MLFRLLPKGVDLMAPVFLAVTNEVGASDSLFGMQRKCKSIEDLCSSTLRHQPTELFEGIIHATHFFLFLKEIGW